MKTVTIGLATAKQAIRQPAFLILTLLAAAGLIWTIYVPYFTLGEDIKMYKDTGLTTIIIAGLILALLTSSSVVTEEIEGRTAITLLSKPINRRQFILGKYLGIELAVLLMFAILGALFAAGVWYKYGYDLTETGGGTAANNDTRLLQVQQILPGLALAFGEVSILTALSVALSTRVPMLVNLVVCMSLYFLGHLTPVLVAATGPGTGANELVRFMAGFFAYLLPSLEFFNAGPSISTGVIVPWVGYVLPALGYCVLYSGAALFLAFLLFDSRDVA
ncbi:MAG: ABC transporter permease subunit [Isosphaeraceae bacterium]